VLALCHLAELSYLQGQLHEAKRYYERALDLTANGQGRQPIACVPLIGLGELQREWNDLEAATRHLTEGIELGKQCGEIWVMSGHMVLANVRQTQGDLEGARQAIQTAQQIAVRFDAMEMDDIKVAVYRARLWLAQGDVEAAARWAAERGLDTEAGKDESLTHDRAASPPILHEYEWITLARLLIARGQPSEALKVLKPLRQKTESARWTRLVIEILVLESLASQALGDVNMALTSLERALSLAAPEGYVRLFVDEGESTAKLLRQAAARGIVPNYVSRLLGAFDTFAYKEAMDSQPLFTQLLVDPLSGRELEVLRLLNTHLSSTEIAEELYIATSTVRSHIKSIYSKLNVHSRKGAVERAEELGLLHTNYVS
jgi:LuxR family maltose regulon positive regulatory protein